MRQIKQLAVGLAVFILQPCFAALITVSPIEIDLSNTQTYTDLTVSNVGHDTAYVTLQPMRVINPGTPQVSYEAMRNNPREFGLVVSPLKVIIPPQLSRKIRVMSLVKNNSDDAIYIVKVVPSEGEMQAVTNNSGDVLAGIQVISGYNALVTVRPAMPRPAIEIIRDGKQLTVKNLGNTQVLLSNAEQCDSKGLCSKLDLVKRMYAGNTWQAELPVAGPVEFLQTYFQNQYTILKSN